MSERTGGRADGRTGRTNRVPEHGDPADRLPNSWRVWEIYRHTAISCENPVRP